MEIDEERLMQIVADALEPIKAAVEKLDEARLDAERERDLYWQALIDIQGWKNWQMPTWREIARTALSAGSGKADQG